MLSLCLPHLPGLRPCVPLFPFAWAAGHLFCVCLLLPLVPGSGAAEVEDELEPGPDPGLGVLAQDEDAAVPKVGDSRKLMRHLWMRWRRLDRQVAIGKKVENSFFAVLRKI